MKQVKGQVINLKEEVIGKVTYKNDIFIKNKILVCSELPRFYYGVILIVIKNYPRNKTKNIPVPILIADLESFNEGDIVSVTPDGISNIIWEINTNHNALYVTDFCNSKCIMCPQPMPTIPKSYFEDNKKIIELIDFQYAKNISITGGEPTLMLGELTQLLKQIKLKNKDIPVHILTNGRTFFNMENLMLINSAGKNNITYAIPIYSNIPEEHDFIVGVDGAFNETIMGLYNLAKNKEFIEVRIVVLKQNYAKLSEIIEFIYRNLPFVIHVAIMGMEYIGLAKNNYEQIHIDPIEYKNNIYDAMKQLIRFNILSSIYNIPFCLTDRRAWRFCRDSISDWKKSYIKECEQCLYEKKCCGLFKTSCSQSENIKKIKETFN